jgi:hypothetical protein
VVAGLFRGSMARIDELIPGEVSDIEGKTLWRPLSELLAADRIHCIMLQHASHACSHHSALLGTGWQLLRTHQSPGLQPSGGIPVRDLASEKSRTESRQIVLGTAGNEGP